MIKTQSAKIWLDEDGIVHYKIIPESAVTLEDTKEYVDIQSKLTKGKKVPNLIDLRGIKAINREAREYFSSEEAVKITAACALLIGSPLSKVIGNFFMSINKPRFPTRMFTSEEKALKWLKGFMEQEEN